jgi:hypothetical protein
MPSPLQPNDHYILRKLSNELLPWMIVGRRVDRQGFVRLASIYAYLGDFGALLAGLGIGTPVVTLMTGSKLPDGRSALDVLREVLPGYWLWVGIVGLVLWGIMRLFVQRENVIARAALAHDCATSIKVLYAGLHHSLSAEDPMPNITAIQKTVDEKVQSAISNKVWPYDPDPLPEESDIASDLKKAVDEIRDKFMDRWSAAPPGVISNV